MIKQNPTNARQKRGSLAHARGLVAEYKALLFLLFHGYRIRAWRYKTKMGEVDIIAQRGRVLAAIEVKARPNALLAHEAISPHSRRRIMKTARHFYNRFLQARANRAKLTLRYDVMIILPKRWPQHIQNAWLDDEG